VLVDVLPNINVLVVQRDQVHALPLGVEAGRPLSPGFNPIASWTILLGRFFGRRQPNGCQSRTPKPILLSTFEIPPTSGRQVPPQRRLELAVEPVGLGLRVGQFVHTQYAERTEKSTG